MEANNLDDNVQTVSRRSRSRKVRGKRRNTIAGIDQKEIQDAANGYVEIEILRLIIFTSGIFLFWVEIILLHMLHTSMIVPNSRLH